MDINMEGITGTKKECEDLNKAIHEALVAKQKETNIVYIGVKGNEFPDCFGTVLKSTTKNSYALPITMFAIWKTVIESAMSQAQKDKYGEIGNEYKQMI